VKYTKELDVTLFSKRFHITVDINGIFKEQAEDYFSILYNIDEAGSELVDRVKNLLLERITIKCDDPEFNKIITNDFWSKANGFVLLTNILNAIMSDESTSINNTTSLEDIVGYYDDSGITLEKAYDLFVFQNCSVSDFLEYLHADIRERSYIISCYETLQGVNVKQRFDRLNRGVADVLDLSTRETDVTYKRKVNDNVEKLIKSGELTEKERELLSTIDWKTHNRLIEQAKMTNNNKNYWANDEILGPNAKW